MSKPKNDSTSGDNTKHKQAQKALRESEEKYRTLFEAMSEGFALCEMIWDEHGKPCDFRYLDVNEAWEKHTGIACDVAKGRTAREIIPEIESFWIESFAKVVRTGASWCLENQVAELDRWFEVFAYKHSDNRFAVIFTDITERKKAEQETTGLLAAVQEEKDTLSALINSIGDEVWFADIEKRFVLANLSAMREFNFADTEDGIDIERFAASVEVYRPDGSPRPVEESPPLRALTGDVVRNQEEVVRTPARGELRYRQVNATPVRDRGGHIIGSVSVVRDITEYRNADEALRQTNEKLSALIHSSPLAVVMLDRDGYVSLWNPAAEDMFGWTEAEALGRPHPVVPKEAWDEFLTILSSIVNGEPVKGLEVQRMRKDGTPIDFRIWAAPLRDRDGQATGVVAILQDITERKKVAEALRESEEKLAKVFHNSTNLVAITRQDDGRIVDVNAAWIRASGCSAKEAIGRMALELGLWPSADVRGACMTRLRKAGRLRDFETRLLFKREETTVLTSCEPLEMNGEQCWLWEFRDITERKKAEEALKRTNEMLSALINCSPLAIDTLDCNGNVTLWNPAAEAAFGWAEAEVLGRFLPIVPAEAKDEFLRYLSTVLAGETLKGQEIRRIRKDGSIAELRVWAAPLRDRDGKAIGCVSVLDDMTERKQLKAQLRQSQRMEAVGRLAGGIAHEFKNLLMGISSYAEMLQMKLGPDHPQFETANELLQCVDRAARLAGQLQTFGRRQSLEIQPTDLNALVSESKHFLEHLLGEHIEMTLDLSGEPAIADVDPSQIEQVLTNLAINARDAMPHGGQLAIKTRVTSIDDLIIRQSHDLNQDRYVEISVTDTGSGMDEATVHQIFEPFFTTKGSDGRMGLGLSVTYGIVRQHKGYIHVRSRPGEGSTFLVYLPAAEHASIADVKHATRQPKSGTETILLAEDEDIVRMPVKSLLEAYGYTVLAAGDGEEAIKLFERHVGEIDLAVLDLVMPKAGGMHVWQVIRETKPDTKVLFISGHTAAVHEDFMPPSDLPLLSKPFSVLNLANKIREILD